MPCATWFGADNRCIHPRPPILSIKLAKRFGDRLNESNSLFRTTRGCPSETMASVQADIFRLARFRTATRDSRHGWCAIKMKRFSRLHTPGLALLTFGFGPADRFPVERENQSRTGIYDLHSIPPGLVYIQKKCLLDGMLVRSGLDFNSVFQENICGKRLPHGC